MHRRGTVADHDDTIATLWDLTFDRIAAEDAASVQLAEICAQLAPEPIPLDLFTNHVELLPAGLREVAADPLSFADAVAVLVDYSLVRRNAAGLLMHRLTQAAIRHRRSAGAERRA